MAVTSAVSQQLDEIIELLTTSDVTALADLSATNVFKSLRDISVETFAGTYVQLWYAGGSPDRERGDSTGGGYIIHSWRLGISVRFFLATDQFKQYVKQAEGLTEMVTAILNLLHLNYDLGSDLWAQPPIWDGTEQADVSKQTTGSSSYVYEANQRIYFKMLAVDPYDNYKQDGGE